MATIKLITPTEAAKILNITRQGFNYLVKKGQVNPVKIIEVPSQIVCKYKLFNEATILAMREKR